MVNEAGLSHEIGIDSAGTAAYHIGEGPDPRAVREAKSRGINISALRARQAKAVDFKRFDYVLAMDRENYHNLLGLCPQGLEGKLSMFLGYAPELGRQDVPDPYYEGDFGSVYEMIHQAAIGLLNDIQTNHLSK